MKTPTVEDNRCSFVCGCCCLCRAQVGTNSCCIRRSLDVWTTWVSCTNIVDASPLPWAKGACFRLLGNGSLFATDIIFGKQSGRERTKRMSTCGEANRRYCREEIPLISPRQHSSGVQCQQRPCLQRPAVNTLPQPPRGKENSSCRQVGIGWPRNDRQEGSTDLGTPGWSTRASTLRPEWPPQRFKTRRGNLRGRG